MQLFKDAYASLEFGEPQKFGKLKLTPIFIDETMPDDAKVSYPY